MSRSDRFDNLALLLNARDDKRFPLFLHELRRKNRTSNNTINRPLVPIDMSDSNDNPVFKNRQPGSLGNELRAFVDTLNAKLDFTLDFINNTINTGGSGDNPFPDAPRVKNYLSSLVSTTPGSVEDFAATLVESNVFKILIPTTSSKVRQNFGRIDKIEFVASEFKNLLVKGDSGSGNAGLGADSGFSFAPDKYYLGRLYTEIDGEADQVVNNLQSFFNEEGELLYTRTDDGKLVDRRGKEVGKGSDAWKALKLSGTCMGTQIKNKGRHDPTVCKNYIENCLLGKGVDKCKEFLKNEDYWGALASEVRKMNPEIALLSLRKFGFRSETGEDGIVSVEPVSEWSKNLSSSLGESDAKAIRKNASLMGYLSALVNIINSSPDILNNRKVDHNVVKSTPLGKYGIQVKSTSNNNMSAASIVRLSNSVQTYNNSLGVAWGVIPNLQQGGGFTQVNELENKYKDRPKYISHELKHTYEGFKRRLHSHNKSIDQNDDKHVYKLLNELAETERKLYKTMMFSEKYATLLELYPLTNNKSQEVLSYDKLKKFVDSRNKYFIKTSKRQSNLLNIVAMLAHDVSKNTSSMKGDL